MTYAGSRAVDLLRAVELVELLHAMPICSFCRHASYVYVCGVSYSASKAPMMLPEALQKKQIRTHVPLPLALHTHLIRSHTHPYTPKCTHAHTSYAPHARPGPSTCVPSCTSYVRSNPPQKNKKIEGEIRRRPHTYIYMM
jgi:hypothetical protein